MKNSNLIKIHSDENDLSEEQKLFNQLSKQIEKKKKELDKWEKYAEEYRQMLNDNYPDRSASIKID